MKYSFIPVFALYFVFNASGCGGTEKLPGFTGEEAEKNVVLIQVPDSGNASATEDDEDGDTASLPDALVEVEGRPQELRLLTWNLKNFSPFGMLDNRLNNIAEVMLELDADLMLLQEVMQPDGNAAGGIAAIDGIRDSLSEFTVLRGEWEDKDTTAALLFRTQRFQVLEKRQIFQTKGFEFPRPPLLVRLRDLSTENFEFGVIVVHLKAYEEDGSDIERRKAACTILDAFIAAQPEQDWIVGGDFNDSPRDTEDNVFVETFLNPESHYVFPTLSLPESAFTFGGTINGDFTGLFLDHFVLTASIALPSFEWTVSTYPISLSDMEEWSPAHSDHLPVILDFASPGD